MLDYNLTVVMPASKTRRYACKYFSDREIEHLDRAIARCQLLKQISRKIPTGRGADLHRARPEPEKR
jgi:hypothetical protein